MSEVQNIYVLNQVDHRYVHVDNEGRFVPVASMVMENNTVTYEFDEMELTGSARLWFYHPPSSQVTVIIHRFMGDKTGIAHLRTDQRVYVEYLETETNITEAPCSYWIDYQAEIILPTEVSVYRILGVLVMDYRVVYWHLCRILVEMGLGSGLNNITIPE